MGSVWRKNVGVGLEVAAEAFLAAMREALPAGCRQRFLGARRWRIVAVGQEVQARGTDLRPLAVALPSEEVLVRRLELPLTSRFHLTRLMRYEAKLRVPLPLDQACLDFRILHRDLAASRMSVELVVIRAEAVAAALAPFGASKPDAVAIPAADGYWLARRPVARDWRRAWLDRRYQQLFLRWAVPAALVVALVMGSQNWAARLVADRDADVDVAHHASAGVEPMRAQMAALNDKLAYLAGLRQQPSAAAVSEEVTRLLPDGAWANELDIEGGNVHLRGTAKNATGLLRIFSNSALFTNVSFDAPLTQEPGSNGQAFDLTMVLRSG